MGKIIAAEASGLPSPWFRKLDQKCMKFYDVHSITLESTWTVPTDKWRETPSAYVIVAGLAASQRLPASTLGPPPCCDEPDLPAPL